MSTTAQLSENSHQGFEAAKRMLCLAAMQVKSNTASEMPVCLRQNVKGSRSSSKERDAETGLDYFGARYYSGAQGRFTSTDPIIHPKQSKDSFNKFLSQPDRWNKYVYAGNNPLKYVDLAGLEKYLAILLDQPLPGKNVAYNDYRRVVPDVGHASVALIDTDTKSFVVKGFHPENADKLLPQFGSSKQPGRIRDDRGRLKNVDSSFFFEISDQAFTKLTNKVKQDSDIKNTPEFDLFKFNCTDYAIGLAKEAGIMLPDPQGAFGDYGQGSNPNMLGNQLGEEYDIYLQKVEEDKIRELRKLLGITK